MIEDHLLLINEEQLINTSFEAKENEMIKI